MEGRFVMKRLLARFTLLLVALSLIACGTVQPNNRPSNNVPAPSFGSAEQLVPDVNPFQERGSRPANIAQTPNTWFVQLEAPSLAEGGTLGTLQAQTANIQSAAMQMGIRYQPRYTFTRLISGFSIRAEETEAAKFRELPGVTRVMEVGLVHLPDTTHVTEPELAFALDMTGASTVQSELGFDGGGIQVGVIDTGIDPDHPDLTERVSIVWDFVGDDYNAGDPDNDEPFPEPIPGGRDCNGHGTHVAGIVGADGDPEVGGARGVAPGASLGVYRVFGCDGSSHTDVIVSAIEQAYQDGMDIVNLSLGASFGWADDFGSVALSRLLDVGVIPVASAGNSGVEGIYAVGSPGAGDNVITVASVNNLVTQLNKMTIAGQEMGYTNAVGVPPAPTSGTSPDIVYVGRGCQGDDYLGDPDGKVALVTRGECPFREKHDRAVEQGAVGIIIENNAPGILNPSLGFFDDDDDIAEFTIMVQQDDGQFIKDAIDAGQEPFITWSDESINVENPGAGLSSGFSSYGPTPELRFKPDIGAPGSPIRSTWLDGEYAALSGTSMSAPHVAGAVALLLQARPDIRLHEVRDVLQNSADPSLWSLNPDIGFLDSVHRQGAGMLRIDRAIMSQTRALPGKLTLGESAKGPKRHVMQIQNDTDEDITYSLNNVNSVVATAGFPDFPTFYGSGARADFEVLRGSSRYERINEITVPAGSLATFRVTITPAPDLPNNEGVIYGGYLAFSPQEDVAGAGMLLVPYMGMKGSYRSYQTIWFYDETAYGALPSNPLLIDPVALDFQDPNQAYTMQEGDLPAFAVEHYLPFQNMRVEIVPVPSNSDSGWIGTQPLFELDLVRRNASGFLHVYGLQEEYDASVLPNGRYRFRLHMLKPLGSRDNSSDVLVWETQPFEIDRPTEP